MFIMYVDECGDTGLGKGASDFFILSGLVVHESTWTDFLRAASSSLFDIYGRHGLDRKLELHAKDMLGRSSKPYSDISKVSRLMILRDVLTFEATQANSIRVINVVVDKTSKTFGYDVFGAAWDALINRFENTIEHGNFAILRPGTTPAYPEHGMIIVDETDEKKLRDLIRRMRWRNLVPSGKQDGACYRHDLNWVIEDALHKQSQHSIPIQLCDANAYFLRQAIKPNTTILKHGARNYFYKLRPVLLKEACRSDPDGIVRL